MNKEVFVKIWEMFFSGNGLQDYIFFLIVFLALAALLPFIAHKILAKLETISKKHQTEFNNSFIKSIADISTLFFVSIALYASTRHLIMPSLLSFLIKALFLFGIVYEAVKLAGALITFVLEKRLFQTKKEASENKQTSSALKLLIRIILWIIGLTLILSNLGFDVTSLVASLGIGSLAVSLALQNILKDLFSSFSITIDKPFEEGDYIIIGDQEGEVKKIGLKTTRLQAVGGEELVVSNNELTNTRIRNYKKMKQRRVKFMFGITYETPVTKLKTIPKTIEKIIKAIKELEFHSAAFKEFGDFSLNFQVIYYIKDNDYKNYLRLQEKINLKIMEAFEKQKIEMAYPTQTVHLVNK